MTVKHSIEEFSRHKSKLGNLQIKSNHQVKPKLSNLQEGIMETAGITLTQSKRKLANSTIWVIKNTAIMK